MANERKIVRIDGVDVNVPSEMSEEEARQRHRELLEAMERSRAEMETLDHAQSMKWIRDDLERRGAAPDLLAFYDASIESGEIAALHRAAGEPLSLGEYVQLMQRRMNNE